MSNILFTKPEGIKELDGVSEARGILNALLLSLFFWGGLGIIASLAFS